MPSTNRLHRLLISSSNSHSILNFRGEMIESLLSAGVSIIVLCTKDKHYSKLKEKFSHSKNVTIQPFDFHNTKINPLLDALTIVRLMVLIKRYKIDSIFSFHLKPILYCSIAAKLLGIKKIFSMVTGLGYTFTDENINKTLKTIITKFISLSLKLNNVIFFQNKDDYKIFSSSKSIKQKSILIPGSGVNTDKFPFSPQPQDLSFLFVGRLLSHKGIREYVNAAKILKKEYPSIIFKVAGSFHPNPSAITKKELNEWVESGTIEYLGEVEDMLAAYQLSSVCVLPSYREGCPRALLEALSIGRPIITCNTAGCKELIKEPIDIYNKQYLKGKNGYLIPIKNTDVLVDVMKQFIHEPKIINEMAKHSRCLAEEIFDVYKVNQVILKNIQNN